MNHDFGAQAQAHDVGTLLQMSSILSELPEGFTVRSVASRGMEIDPVVTPDQVRAAVVELQFSLISENTSHAKNLWFVKDSSELLHVAASPGNLSFYFHSSGSEAEKFLAPVVKAFEKYRVATKPELGVWADFSCQGQIGAGVERRSQFLRCPAWPDIKENYCPQARVELERLMGLDKPHEQGRLMMWYGVPGTGKTFAIRSLMMAWRKNFNFLVVTDPEKMLATPSYYYELAANPGRDSEGKYDDGEDESPPEKRLLFIFEDSADLIVTQSREKHWDKVGKLLNMTDGLIGQGRQDVFLITFNERLDQIDPAVARPGRCLSKVEFSALAESESKDWLRKRNVRLDRTPGSSTIAELYQILGKEGEKAPDPVTAVMKD